MTNGCEAGVTKRLSTRTATGSAADAKPGNNDKVKTADLSISVPPAVSDEDHSDQPALGSQEIGLI